MSAAPSLACKVRQIVMRHLDVDDALYGPGLAFATVGAGDLAMMAIVMDVEDLVDAEATDADASAVQTVGDLVRLAERLAAGEAVAA